VLQKKKVIVLHWLWKGIPVWERRRRRSMRGMEAMKRYVANMAGQNPAVGMPHRWAVSMAQDANRSTTTHATSSPSPRTFSITPSNSLPMLFSIADSIAKKSGLFSSSSWPTPSARPTHFIPSSSSRWIWRWIEWGRTMRGWNPWARKAQPRFCMGVTCPCAGYGTRITIFFFTSFISHYPLSSPFRSHLFILFFQCNLHACDVRQMHMCLKNSISSLSSHNHYKHWAAFFKIFIINFSCTVNGKTIIQH